MTCQIQYRVTTLSPVLLTRIIGNTHILTTDEYLPGSSIRGMLSNRYIFTNNLGDSAHERDERFCHWFLQGELQFTNAYIEGLNEYDEVIGYYPTPISIQEEKDGNKIYDLLRQKDFPDQQTKSVGGFCQLSEGQLDKKDIRKSLYFHHVRNPETGTAQEGGFFNYEAIESEQTFHGFIIGSEVALKELSALFDKPLNAYMGRSKNAQYGKVTFEIVSDKPQPFYSETGYSGTDTELKNDKMSLTLLSDTIIYNENGFPSIDIKVLESQKYLNTTIARPFVKTGDTENFVSVWRLRKPSERCFLAGSCFLIEVTDENKAALLNFLREGLGERCHEGFGRIALNWQTEPILSQPKPWQQKLDKPGSAADIPAIAKDILHGTIASLISEAEELKALQNASKFKNPQKPNQGFPSKSLIGRLELMLRRHCEDPIQGSFKNSLEKLRGKKAEKTLNACRSEELRKTLWDYLKEYDPNVEEILRDVQYAELEAMAQRVNFNFENSQFKAELYSKYLQVFFSAMRRLQKPVKEVQK